MQSVIFLHAPLGKYLFLNRLGLFRIIRMGIAKGLVSREAGKLFRRQSGLLCFLQAGAAFCAACASCLGSRLAAYSMLVARMVGHAVISPVSLLTHGFISKVPTRLIWEPSLRFIRRTRSARSSKALTLRFTQRVSLSAFLSYTLQPILKLIMRPSSEE